jgi:hypothetical protein
VTGDEAALHEFSGESTALARVQTTETLAARATGVAREHGRRGYHRPPRHHAVLDRTCWAIGVVAAAAAVGSRSHALAAVAVYEPTVILVMRNDECATSIAAVRSWPRRLPMAGSSMRPKASTPGPVPTARSWRWAQP